MNTDLAVRNLLWYFPLDLMAVVFGCLAEVTRLLLYAAQASHELVPPEVGHLHDGVSAFFIEFCCTIIRPRGHC